MSTINVYLCDTPQSSETGDGLTLQTVWNVDLVRDTPGEELDAADIDPIKILTDAAFNALPDRGDTYSLGTNLTAVSRDVGELQRIPNDDLIRRQVVVSYEQIVLQGSNGQVITAASLDPTNWIPEVVVNGQMQSYNVSRALFKGFYESDFTTNDYDPCAAGYVAPTMQDVSNSFATMEIDKHSPIQNTAGRTFAEGIDIGRVDQVIEITKYFSSFNLDAGKCYQNKLNSAAVDLSIAGKNFTFNADPLELWLVRFKPRAQRLAQFNLNYWAITYELLYRKGGHYIDISNIGTVRGLQAGDPDGHGGTVSQVSTPGVSPVMANRGLDGFVDEDPKFLNRSGRSFVDEPDATFLRYQAQPTMDFNDANLALVGNGVGP